MSSSLSEEKAYPVSVASDENATFQKFFENFFLCISVTTLTVLPPFARIEAIPSRIAVSSGVLTVVVKSLCLYIPRVGRSWRLRSELGSQRRFEYAYE